MMLFIIKEVIVIPENLRQQFITIAHKDHWGIKPTSCVLKQEPWWPGIDKEIRNFINIC